MSLNHHEFDTVEPAKIYVEINKGTIKVSASSAAPDGTHRTQVRLSGDDLDALEVRQEGDEISIIDPRKGGGFLRMGSTPTVVVEIETSPGAQLRTKTGSADIITEGDLAALWAQTGSGDVVVASVSGPMTVATGSGDVVAENVAGEFNVKTGSGDVVLGTGGGEVNVATGSGDLQIRHASGAIGAKTGSGDVQVVHAESDVSLATGSGDLVVARAHTGTVNLNGASSDMRVGVVAGTPVWTDINTLSGSIRSGLRPVGVPGEGQNHIRLVARTVSGDIILEEV